MGANIQSTRGRYDRHAQHKHDHHMRRTSQHKHDHHMQRRMSQQHHMHRSAVMIIPASPTRHRQPLQERDSNTPAHSKLNRIFSHLRALAELRYQVGQPSDVTPSSGCTDDHTEDNIIWLDTAKQTCTRRSAATTQCENSADLSIVPGAATPLVPSVVDVEESVVDVEKLEESGKLTAQQPMLRYSVAELMALRFHQRCVQPLENIPKEVRRTATTLTTPNTRHTHTAQAGKSAHNKEHQNRETLPLRKQAETKQKTTKRQADSAVAQKSQDLKCVDWRTGGSFLAATLCCHKQTNSGPSKCFALRVEAPNFVPITRPREVISQKLIERKRKDNKKKRERKKRNKAAKLQQEFRVQAYQYAAIL